MLNLEASNVFIFLRRATGIAVMKYITNSLIYVSATIIYWIIRATYFDLFNRSSSGLQQNKSKVLLEYWDPNILYSCKLIQNLVLDKM